MFKVIAITWNISSRTATRSTEGCITGMKNEGVEEGTSKLVKHDTRIGQMEDGLVV